MRERSKLMDILLQIRFPINWLLPILLVMMCCEPAVAQQVKHDHLLVVPAPEHVAIDGDLRDWDLSGTIDTALDEKSRPQFTVKLAAMYDANALYIGAHFTDPTPLMNRHDPRVVGGGGWNADCLQVRLCSDVAQPYPLPAKLDIPAVCDLMIWYYTDAHEPVLWIGYGIEGPKSASQMFLGKDSGVAFAKDADNQGWTVEARIPWERLHAPRPPKAGERMAFIMQPFWGDATGATQVSYFYDVVRTTGFAYSDRSMWGQAQFLATGNLAPEDKPTAAAQQPLPITTKLTLPDGDAKVVSAALYDTEGKMVRTLLAGTQAQPMASALDGARIVDRSGESLTVAWDGCDDHGHPLPAGNYALKVLTGRGIGQRWVASVHNSGQPSWFTDDGTGNWGGDHAPAIGAAADQERVYLLWAGGECSTTLIACRPDGRKLWGTKAIGSRFGQGCYAVAVDGDYVYVLQDGYLYGQQGVLDQSRTCVPEIVRWDAASGKPVNFPFGQRDLKAGEWSDSLMLPGFVFKYFVYNADYCSYPVENGRFKRPWEKLPTHDFGPQELARNAIGLAVRGNLAYVAKYLENKVEAYDITTGNQAQGWNLLRPAGLAAAADGTIYAVSGHGVVKLLPEGKTAPVVSEGLSSPWGLTVGKDGRLSVSDCGDAMQVKVFDQQGKLIETIGKKGGRPWVGKYDPAGMLEPAGLALDRDGKLWVCEYDTTPMRISTWQPDGALHKEFFGPGSYSVFASVDKEQPNLVCVHNTLFDVNYDTGAVKPVCTFSRNTKGLQFQPNRFEYEIRHVQGHTYAVSMDKGGAVIFEVTQSAGGVPVAEPVAAWGILNLLQFQCLWKEDLPAKAQELYWPNRKNVMYQWHDLSGDRIIQDDEWIFTPVDQTSIKSPWGLYCGNWVDEQLTFWTASVRGKAMALPVKEWKDGVPIYAPFSAVEPSFTLDEPACNRMLPDGDALYLTFGTPFDSAATGKVPGAIEKRLKSGEKVWTYARTYFGVQAPLPAPGDVIAPWVWQSLTHTPSGLGLLLANGYFGQYFLLDTDGLYVGALCKDSRTGPALGPDVILMENFNGTFFHNRRNGKYYAIGGDTDARIWEVTGIDTLRKGTEPLTIGSAEAQMSARAVHDVQGATTRRAALRIARASAGFDPAKLSSWDLHNAVSWDAGAGRTAKAALAYDTSNLYAVYQVTDSSPMANGGTDWPTLFKTGDTCEIMLAADPHAEAGRVKPAAGDMRLLFSVMDGKPIAVLYEAVARPGEETAPNSFASPARAEVFQRVVRLPDAAVTVERSASGYVLSAAVPLKDLGFKPQGKTKGDVGVLFSDQGGTHTAIRTYYFNHHTGITGDLPSEARLQPADWGTLEVK